MGEDVSLFWREVRRFLAICSLFLTPLAAVSPACASPNLEQDLSPLFVGHSLSIFAVFIVEAISTAETTTVIGKS